MVPAVGAVDKVAKSIGTQGVASVETNIAGLRSFHTLTVGEKVMPAHPTDWSVVAAEEEQVAASELHAGSWTRMKNPGRWH